MTIRLAPRLPFVVVPLSIHLSCRSRDEIESQVVLEIARLIREDFLQQNAFTDYDYTCPLYKSLGMLKVKRDITLNRVPHLAVLGTRLATKTEKNRDRRVVFSILGKKLWPRSGMVCKRRGSFE